MNEIERVVEECLECGLCVGECEFLTQYCDSPREFAESILDGELAEKAETAFLCNMCGYCATSCPEALDLGQFFMQVRQRVVEEGIKLPGNLKYLKMTQDYVNSAKFLLSLSGDGQCDQVFFPGCHLSGYSPDLVMTTYGWLRERNPNLGIVLQCCGAPDLDTGNTSAYVGAIERLETTLEEMGAKEIIAACPNCIYHFRKYAPQIQVTSLYEVMEESWPEGAGDNGNGALSMHDPCTAREEVGLQKAARTLIGRAGYQVESIAESGENTRCCGQGGLVPYVSMNFAAEMSKERAEALGEKVVTYCASCREAFAPYKPSLHILDVLFNQDVEAAGQLGAHKPAVVKKNQANLKKMLLDVYGDGQ